MHARAADRRAGVVTGSAAVPLQCDAIVMGRLRRIRQLCRHPNPFVGDMTALSQSPTYSAKILIACRRRERDDVSDRDRDRRHWHDRSRSRDRSRHDRRRSHSSDRDRDRRRRRCDCSLLRWRGAGAGGLNGTHLYQSHYYGAVVLTGLTCRSRSHSTDDEGQQMYAVLCRTRLCVHTCSIALASYINAREFTADRSSLSHDCPIKATNSRRAFFSALPGPLCICWLCMLLGYP